MVELQEIFLVRVVQVVQETLRLLVHLREIRVEILVLILVVMVQVVVVVLYQTY